MVLALSYLLVTLVPIHGAFYLGIRAERIKNKKLVHTMYKFMRGGRHQ